MVDQPVAAILYNHNDQDYCENIIDKRSLEFFEKNIGKVQNLLSRTVLWYNIQAMNVRGDYRLDKFTHLVDNALFDEKI